MFEYTKLAREKIKTRKSSPQPVEGVSQSSRKQIKAFALFVEKTIAERVPEKSHSRRPALEQRVCAPGSQGQGFSWKILGNMKYEGTNMKR